MSKKNLKTMVSQRTSDSKNGTSSKATASVRHQRGLDGVRVETADVLDILKAQDENSFDGCLCDPPYALGLMGKAWDATLPSMDVWSELLRVAKPGAMLLAFGHPRTHHRLMVAIEDAGWEIRDCLMWLFSGVPKGHDISKGIDRELNVEREKVYFQSSADGRLGGRVLPHPCVKQSCHGYHEADGPIPATVEAAQWLGYRTALKPGYEPIVLAQKPCEGSFAANALN